MTDPGAPLTRLLVTLSRLAASADTQVSYLVSIGAGESADELVLEFDDTYRVVRSRVDDFTIPARASEDLARLDALLEQMSGPLNAQLWTLDALHTSVEWSTVRQLAENVVRELEP